MNVLSILWALAFESAIVYVVRSTRADLRRIGGRPAAFLLASAAAGLAAPFPLLFLLRPDLAWVELGLCVPVYLAYFFPGFALRASGGPLPRWGLARATQRIKGRWDARVTDGTVTVKDVAWLQESSVALERWRSPETSELVDLYQSELADILAHTNSLAEDRVARNARIDELVRRFDDPEGRGCPEDR